MTEITLTIHRLKRTNHWLESQQPIISWLNWPMTATIRRIYTINWRSTIHVTLKMTSAQVVEMSVIVTNNSSFQNYTNPDDHTQLTKDTTGEYTFDQNYSDVMSDDLKLKRFQTSLICTFLCLRIMVITSCVACLETTSWITLDYPKIKK